MNEYEAILEAVSAGTEIMQAVLGLVMSLAVYILQGIALYRMAGKLGIGSPWLAFVPIGNVWLLGKIADANEAVPKHAKRLLILNILLLIPVSGVLGVALGALLAGIPELGVGAIAFMFTFGIAMLVLAIVCSVFTYIAYYRICENFAQENKTGYFLGILLGGMCCSELIPPILLLVLSGKEPGSNMQTTYTTASWSENQN